MREIQLSQGKFAIVDDEDYEKLIRYKWHALKIRNVWYACRNSLSSEGRSRTLLYMHRSILNSGKGVETDHINGDGLDNRKENLRAVTPRYNQQNQHRIKKVSPHIGIYRQNPLNGRWCAHINYRGRSRYLGCFDNEIDAATVYRVACAVLIGGDV